MLDQVLEAVAVATGPAWSNEQRLEAYNVLQQFQETCSVEMAFQTALSILAPSTGDGGAPSYDDQARHYALHLLDTCIRFRWNTDLSLDDKERAKSLSLHLLKHVAASCAEARFIREKLAELVVQIAVREWPQRWPSLLPDLRFIADNGSAVHLELVLLFFRALFDSLTPLPPSRRRDMLTTLAEQADNVTGFIASVLQRTIAVLPSDERDIMLVAMAALEAVASVATWIPASTHGTSDLILATVQLIHVHEAHCELATRACESLLVFVERKFTHGETLVLDCLWQTLDGIHALFNEVSAHVVNLLQLRVPLTQLETPYLLLKRVSQLIAEIGASQVCSQCERLADTPPAQLPAYLDLLLKVSAVPSTTTDQLVFLAWCEMESRPALARVPAFKEAMPHLLRCAIAKALPREPYDENALDQIDYDSEETMHDQHSTYNSIVHRTLRAVAKHAPKECVALVSEAFDGEITMVAQLAAAAAAAAADSESTASAAVAALNRAADRLEACAKAASSALSAATTSALFRLSPLPDEIITPVRQLCLDLARTATTAAASRTLVAGHMSALGALAPLLIHVPDTLAPVVAALFDGVVFLRQSGGCDIAASLDEGDIEVRVRLVQRIACTSLIKVCEQAASALLTCFDILLEPVRNMLTSNLVTYYQRSFLFEALVIVANAAGDSEQQCDFLASISEHVIVELTTDEDILALLEGPAAFAAALDIGMQSSSSSMTAQTNTAAIFTASSLQLRRKLHGILNTVAGILRRAHRKRTPLHLQHQQPHQHSSDLTGASSTATTTTTMTTAATTASGTDSASEASLSFVDEPAAPLAFATLQNCLRLATVLDELFTPDGRQLVPPHLQRAVFHPSDPEIRMLLALPTLPSVPAQTPEAQLSRLSIFLTMLRETLSLCITHSLVAAPSLFRSPDAMDALAPTLLAPTLSGDFRHVKLLLRGPFQSLMTSCPPDARLAALEPILPGLISTVFTHLDSEWRKWSDEQLAACTAPGADESFDAAAADATSTDDLTDVLRQRLWRDTAREFVHALYRLLSDTRYSGNALRDDPNARPLSDLGRFVMQTPKIGTVVMESVGEMLLWPDSRVCLRAVDSAMVLLDSVRLPAYHTFVGATLFSYAIQALSVNGQHDECQAHLVAMIWHAYKVFDGLVESGEAPEHLPRGVLLSLPGSNEAALVDFEASLRRTTKDKRQRELFKTALHDLIRVSYAEQHNREHSAKTVQALPETVVRMKVRRKQESVWEAEANGASMGDGDSPVAGIVDLFADDG